MHDSQQAGPRHHGYPVRTARTRNSDQNEGQKIMNKPIRVSIVDDEVDLRENIAGYVNADKAFRCVSLHSSAEEALAQLPKEKPDVVLMDINLGGMSGIECVRLLKPQMR